MIPWQPDFKSDFNIIMSQDKKGLWQCIYFSTKQLLKNTQKNHLNEKYVY